MCILLVRLLIMGNSLRELNKKKQVSTFASSVNKKSINYPKNIKCHTWGEGLCVKEAVS